MHFSYTFGEPVRGTAYVAVRGPSRYGPNPFCKPMPMPMPMPMPFASQSSMNTGPSASEFGRSMAFGGGYRPQSEFADCQPIDLSVWKNFTIEVSWFTSKIYRGKRPLLKGEIQESIQVSDTRIFNCCKWQPVILGGMVWCCA